MLQTLKTPLNERSVIVDIEIKRNADVKIDDDVSAEDVDTLKCGELVDEAEVGSYGPNEGPDWSDKIDAVDNNIVQNDEKHEENALAIDAYGGGDREEIVVEKIHIDLGDLNHDGLAESKDIHCRTSTTEETRCAERTGTSHPLN
jgi:hypothetical protein